MTNGIELLMKDVAEFHAATDQEIRQYPFIDRTRVELRNKLLEEEVRETIEAANAGDLVELADGLADVIYIAIGTAVEFGLPLDKVWDAVQRSNMAKVDPETGMVRRREDGKILKPAGWEPPNVAEIIKQAGL